MGRPRDDADVGRHLAERGVRDVRRGPLPREGLGFAPGATLSASYDDGLYGGRLAPPVVADRSAPFANTGSVYYKGARALHMLRRLVGDATFFPALRAYGDAHAWGTASRADLRGDFERASGLDLKQFFDQWVETPFRPVLRATYQNALDASTVTLAVTQTQGHTVVHPVAGPNDTPFYVFPLVVQLTYLDGTTFDVTVNLDGPRRRRPSRPEPVEEVRRRHRARPREGPSEDRGVGRAGVRSCPRA